MLLLIVPLLWMALWVVLSLVICAAIGIPAGDPRLWWYAAGVFAAGGLGLPAAAVAAVVAWQKRHCRD